MGRRSYFGNMKLTELRISLICGVLVLLRDVLSVPQLLHDLRFGSLHHIVCF